MVSVFSRIPRGSSVFIDSAPIIYLLENHPQYADYFARLFTRIYARELVGVISAITIAEVATGPIQKGHPEIAEQYRATLLQPPFWIFAPIDDQLALHAAEMRAHYHLKLPDALQLACALTHRCHSLVTHDRDFSKVKEIKIIS